MLKMWDDSVGHVVFLVSSDMPITPRHVNALPKMVEICADCDDVGAGVIVLQMGVLKGLAAPESAPLKKMRPPSRTTHPLGNVASFQLPM